MPASQMWWEPSTPPIEHDFSPEKLDPDNISTDSNEDLPTRRIHILGTGSIGCLVAHSLVQLPNAPPITLMLHRPEVYGRFQQASRIVRLINKTTDVNDEQTGFDVDVLSGYSNDFPYWEHHPHQVDKNHSLKNTITEAEKMGDGEVFIYNLIVSVKGPRTRQALQSIKHRVNAKTTILLMQNGLGQIDELNEHVFTDPATRPTYMLGIISHGCYLTGPFNVVHAGIGTVALGVYRDTDRFPLPAKGTETIPSNLDEAQRKVMFPTDTDLYSNISARYLLRTLTRCPTLACAAYPYLDLFQLQLEKLVTNCLLNPLTAIMDVNNGATLSNPPLTRVQRLLLSEIALVLRGLPELEGIPNVRARFSPARLELRFQTVATQTARNSSSMREDMRWMQDTEIDYINGYIVKRGEEQGIKCVLNYMIMQLIKAKTYHLKSESSLSKGAPRDREDLRAEFDLSADGTVVLEDLSRPSG